MHQPVEFHERTGNSSSPASFRPVIFVVEDEEDIARLISHNLQAAGFEVQSFVSGASVLTEAVREMPALFLLVGGLAVLHLAWPAALAWPDPLPDAAATLAYVANWHFVAGNANYFAPSFPSPSRRSLRTTSCWLDNAFWSSASSR